MAAEDVDLFRLTLPSWFSCAGERAGKGAGKSLKIWKPWKCDGASHENHSQHVFWRFLVLSGLLLQKIEGEPLDSFAEEYCSPVKLVHLPSGDSLWHYFCNGPFSTVSETLNAPLMKGLKIFEAGTKRNTPIIQVSKNNWSSISPTQSQQKGCDNWQLNRV